MNIQGLFGRGGGRRMSNAMGRPMAPMGMPMQDPASLDIPLEDLLAGLETGTGELDSTPNTLLLELLQGVRPSSVREAVLMNPATMRRRMPSPAAALRPSLSLTPDELALVTRQQAQMSAGPSAIRPNVGRAFPRRMGDELPSAPMMPSPRLTPQGRRMSASGRMRSDAELNQLQNAGQMTALQALLARTQTPAAAQIRQRQNAGQMTGLQSLLAQLFPSLR